MDPLSSLGRAGSRTPAFLLAVGLVAGCQPEPGAMPDGELAAAEEPAPSAEHGRYLAVVAGCNDCHTDGYLQLDGDVPEERWLMGSPMGWRGPWGTTYPKNLRLTAQTLSEDQWVELLRTRTTLPPMPWSNVNQMSERDARSLHRYLRTLQPTGDAMPLPVPPNQEPTTPYLSLEPVMPGGA